MANPHDLGDLLCKLEPQNADLRREYEQALRNVLERKMSWGGKVFVALAGVMSVGIAVFLGGQALARPELQELARLGLGGGAIIALAWTVLMIWTLRRGTWYGKIQPTAIAVLTWLCAVFMETLFLVLAPAASNPYLATIAILAGLGILVGAGVQFLGTCVQQSELRTREALLRMEYRMAELAEEMDRDRHQ